jgi:methionyl-tRNA synthetase
VPFGNDGDFSRDSIKNRINGELANNFGNLIQRVLSFIVKNLDQNIELTDNNFKFNTFVDILEMEKSLNKHISNYKFDEYLKEIFVFLNSLNNYVDKQAPWALKKTNPDLMKEVLANICICIIRLTQYLHPFMPNKTIKILSLFNLDESFKSFSKIEEILNMKSLKINQPEPLFQKIE